ncbi:MAG TPA: OsmC family protein [Bacteroidales bacterium]|nr:OsmC family protein [Bacteroidales bacterium]
MADFIVEYTGDLRTVMTHIRSGSEVVTDAPVDNKGRGAHFSPTDLVASALASCMLTIMGISAREHGFNIEGARAEVKKVMGSGPRKIAEIHIDLYFPSNNYTDKQKKLLDLASKTCPVALSLHPELKQMISLHFENQENDN